MNKKKMKISAAILTITLVFAGLFVFIPIAIAAPTILPISSSAYLVSSSDRIVWLCHNQNPLATNCAQSGNDFSLEVVGPDGTQTDLVFTGEFGATVTSSVTCGGFTSLGIVFPLTAFAGKPGDGTWTLTAPAGGVANGPNLVCINVSTKTLVYCYPNTRASTNPYLANQNQLWNWRIAATQSNDDGVPSCNGVDDTSPSDAFEGTNDVVYFRPGPTGTSDEMMSTADATPTSSGSGSTSWTVNAFITPQVNGGRTFNDAVFELLATTTLTIAPDTDLRGFSGHIEYDAGDPPTCCTTFAHAWTGLTPSTNYYYQVIGKYSTGGEDLGLVLRFTTTASPSTTVSMDDNVVTLTQSTVGFQSATLNGAYSAKTINGDELNQVMFVWVIGNHADLSDLRPVTGSTTTTAQSPASTYSQAITGLTAATTYSFQALGKRTTSPTWETLGLVLTFSTTIPDANPHPFTQSATITCPATLNLNGFWAKGANAGSSDHTYTQFIIAGGTQTANDLRTVPGFQTTTNTDQGTGTSGTVTATSFYNNGAGSSYQLVARNGSAGPAQLGAVLFSAPNQCSLTPTSIVGFSHAEDNFDLSISQAQCNGDATSFTIDTAINTGTLTAISIDIYDTNTGNIILTIPQTQMFQVATGITSSVFIAKAFLAPGIYAGVGEITLSGTLAKNFYDSKAFDVPQGACGNTVVDVLAINSHTDIVQTKINKNLTRIEQTNNETEDHTDYIMTQINETLRESRLLWNSFNQTKTEIRQAWATLNETEDHTDEILVLGPTINATRILLSSLSSMLNETEDHTDNIMSSMSTVNSTRTQLSNEWSTLNNTRILVLNTWATVNATHSAITIIGTQVNETEAHTDDIMAQQVSQRAQNNASFGDLNNHFHQTDSYINQTNKSIMQTLMTFVFGGNVSFNDTQIQQDLISVLNPLNDFYWLALVVLSVLSIFLLPRFGGFAGFILSLLAMFYANNNFSGIFRTIGIAASVMIFGLAIWKTLDDNKEKKLRQGDRNNG